MGSPLRLRSSAGIAQLVERVIRNDEVVGSIPISGTRYSFHAVQRRLMKPQKPAKRRVFLCNIVQPHPIEAKQSWGYLRGYIPLLGVSGPGKPYGKRHRQAHRVQD